MFVYEVVHAYTHTHTQNHTKTHTHTKTHHQSMFLNWACQLSLIPPHIKGHQSLPIQRESQIFREGPSPHKSVVGENGENTIYPKHTHTHTHLTLIRRLSSPPSDREKETGKKGFGQRGNKKARERERERESCTVPKFKGAWGVLN